MIIVSYETAIVPLIDAYVKPTIPLLGGAVIIGSAYVLLGHK